MLKFKSKQDIKRYIIEHNGIGLEAGHMVGGIVSFNFSKYGNVKIVCGFPDQWEKDITTLEELVDYVWVERKRVIDSGEV